MTLLSSWNSKWNVCLLKPTYGHRVFHLFFSEDLFHIRKTNRSNDEMVWRNYFSFRIWLLSEGIRCTGCCSPAVVPEGIHEGHHHGLSLWSCQNNSSMLFMAPFRHLLMIVSLCHPHDACSTADLWDSLEKGAVCVFCLWWNFCWCYKTQIKCPVLIEVSFKWW